MSKSQKAFNRKQKRAFQRILTGLKVNYGKRLRFLTLTTKGDFDAKKLANDFKLLKQRIRYRYRFEYFKIMTREGNGVIHCLYFGDYIPQSWLSQVWAEIHFSPIVDIRACKTDVKDAMRLSRYCIMQYVQGQGFERYSWSWNWAFKGFVKVWKYFVRISNFNIKEAIKEFNRYIYRKGWLIKNVRLVKTSLYEFGLQLSDEKA